MKKILLSFISVLVLLTGCANSEVKHPENSKYRITKAVEFVDIDSNTIRFLFKTAEGSEVVLYAGKDPKDMKEVGRTDKFDYKKGMTIGGFEPDTKYYYKITAKIEGKKITSETYNFIKLRREKVTSKSQWAKNSVCYQIFVRSFYDSNGDGIGDLKGIEMKLDYLKELGVDALWLMPINEARSYHGYDVQDYYKIETDYGTEKDFDSLVKAAHEKGIKIILDMVFNHSIVDDWMNRGYNGEMPYESYFVVEYVEGISHNLPGFGRIKNGRTFLGSFSCKDLNYRSPYLREEMKRVSKYWIDKGVDGFRLDAAYHIDDFDITFSRLWWQELNEYCRSLNSEFYMVQENWLNEPQEIAPFFEDTDSSFNFPLRERIIDAVSGKNVKLIEFVNNYINEYSKYSSEFTDATFLSNHDTGRIAGTVKKDEVALATTILFTLPGTPYILYGDEIGQKGSNEDSARAPFDWYRAGEGNGMTTWMKSGSVKKDDGVSAEEQLINKNGILAIYKKLIKLRKENKVIFNGKIVPLQIGKGTLSYKIFDEKNEIVVIHNLTTENMMIDSAVFEGYDEIFTTANREKGETTLTSKSSIIYKKKTIN